MKDFRKQTMVRLNLRWPFPRKAEKHGRSSDYFSTRTLTRTQLKATLKAASLKKTMFCGNPTYQIDPSSPFHANWGTNMAYTSNYSSDPNDLIPKGMALCRRYIKGYLDGTLIHPDTKLKVIGPSYNLGVDSRNYHMWVDHDKKTGKTRISAGCRSWGSFRDVLRHYREPVRKAKSPKDQSHYYKDGKMRIQQLTHLRKQLGVVEPRKR